MKRAILVTLLITICVGCFSQELRVYPLHPYSVLKSGSCTKYYLIKNDIANADGCYSSLKNILDSSMEEKFFISQCRLTEYIFYKASTRLDTTYRDTLPNSLSNHREDLRAKMSFKAGKPFLFTFYDWDKSVFFLLDDAGKIITKSMQKN